MLDLTALVGNEAAKQHLQAARGLSHAYLLAGPPGSGTLALAHILAKAFLCAGAGDKIPCGCCENCRKLESGIHPDLITVRGEDDKAINVAQIRNMRADAYIRPNEADRKVYLIEDAGNMNASCQNALLKLLEDGPPYAAFLLLTENAGTLLETVRSRCETIRLSPEPGDERGGGEVPREKAAALKALLLGRDERALLEFCVAQEQGKGSRDELSLLLEETIQQLSCGLKNGDEPRKSLALIETAKALNEALAFNVAPGHILGALSAKAFTP